VDREPLISLSDISKVYVVGSIRSEVLKGLSVRIEAGEYMAVVGASGSGKSTLLNIMGCLDAPTSGSYRLQGEEIARKNDTELARIRNRTFGFVFQSFHLLGRYSAAENVALPMIYRGVTRSARLDRARALLARVGLEGFADHRPSELSGGMQQRVAIARALANEPAVLFADEPTGNLDSKTGLEIIELFGRLHAEGATLVVVSHDQRVAQHARRVVTLEDGRIIDDRRHAGEPMTGARP
jgi:putative ABC transport system ATP-binding protein